MQIYTDGSFINGKGGWAYVVVVNNEKVDERYGSVEKPTNNRAELTAIIKALEDYPQCDVILSDSEYCVKTFNQWIDQWKKRGWKKSDGKIPLNLDLIMKIDALRQNVKFQHVYGHNGNYWNEYVDHLAKCGCKL